MKSRELYNIPSIIIHFAKRFKEHNMSSEWHRFEEVTEYVPAGRRLFRSSAPNYENGDASQNLTQTAVDFLKTKGIKGIISFNQFPYTADERKLLSDAGINTAHLPVVDFAAPTLAQLSAANDFFRSALNPSVLVHCGYGWGRTGTGITALQLYSTNGANPPEADWKSVNHVEEDSQVQVLRLLRDQLKAN